MARRALRGVVGLLPPKMRRMGDTTATETTPLVANVGTAGTSNDDPNDEESPRASHFAWQRLAAKVRQGDMLLRAVTSSQSGLPDNDKQNPNNNTEQQRQRAQAWIRQGVEFTLWQCLLAMLAYMAVAILAFTFVLEPQWTCVDSLYFAIVTFTTIGYGDLVPDTFGARVFTCVFSLSGVACLGIALGVIGTNVMEAQEKAVERTKKLAQARVLHLFGGKRNTNNSAAHPLKKPQAAAADEYTLDTDDETTTDTATFPDADDDALGDENPPLPRKSHPLVDLLFHFALVLVILAVFAFCVAHDPGVDVDKAGYFDALYYTIITASTVGYGDLAPKTQRGRLLAIFFIPLSVGAMGHFLSSVASVIMDSRRSSFQRQMERQELSMQDLEIMDQDGDGTVTRAEYLEFMLVAMNKVDKDFIDEIRASFARLDVDRTGVLSKQDLVQAARLKLQAPTKKLELAQYKERLLLQAQRERERHANKPHGHRKTGSFWEDNFSFVSNVFGKDECDEGSIEAGSLV